MPISDHVLWCAQEAIQRALESMANNAIADAKSWANLASRILALSCCPHTDPKLFKDLVP